MSVAIHNAEYACGDSFKDSGCHKNKKQYDHKYYTHAVHACNLLFSVKTNKVLINFCLLDSAKSN